MKKLVKGMILMVFLLALMAAPAFANGAEPTPT